MSIRALSFNVAIALSFVAAPLSAEQGKTKWQTLEQGLQLAVFVSPQISEYGDSRVRVLRVDPTHFELKLINASAGDKTSRTAQQWSQKHHLVAAINTSMYQKDYLSSVSLMRTVGHVNNPHLSRDKTILAFGPKNKKDAPVKLIDRQCDDLEFWRKRYTTLIQSIRMISCKNGNVWQQQKRKWSTAAIGVDNKDRVLFIHVRSPYSTHDLINILLRLPLNIKGMMYVEGGPEAQLYIKSGKHEYEWFGSFETGFNEDNKNAIAWPIPNVVGIVRR